MTNSHSFSKIIAGFLAGFLAVLIFHQGIIFLLNLVGAIKVNAWSFLPVKPYNVPDILNKCFWGGLWGVLFAFIHHRFFPSLNLLLKGIVYGLLGSLLVGWFIIAPMKGQPMMAGLDPTRMLIGAMIAGSFGFGIAFLLPKIRRLF